jgi:hypothetical protein
LNTSHALCTPGTEKMCKQACGEFTHISGDSAAWNMGYSQKVEFSCLEFSVISDLVSQGKIIHFLRGQKDMPL